MLEQSHSGLYEGALSWKLAAMATEILEAVRERIRSGFLFSLIVTMFAQNWVLVAYVLFGPTAEDGGAFEARARDLANFGMRAWGVSLAVAVAYVTLVPWVDYAAARIRDRVEARRDSRVLLDESKLAEEEAALTAERLKLDKVRSIDQAHDILRENSHEIAREIGEVLTEFNGLLERRSRHLSDWPKCVSVLEEHMSKFRTSSDLSPAGQKALQAMREEISCMRSALEGKPMTEEASMLESLRKLERSLRLNHRKVVSWRYPDESEGVDS